MQKRSEAKNRCQSHRSGRPLVTPLGSRALLSCCGKFLSDGLSDIFFSLYCYLVLKQARNFRVRQSFTPERLLRGTT